MFLNACALPRSGPLLHEVTAANKASRIVLSSATPELVAGTREPAAASFPASFLGAQPIDYERFATGDGVDVVIWERDDLQVFPPGTTGASDLGIFQVDKEGAIQIPYVGSLSLAGLTPESARLLLLRRLRGLVIASDVRLSQAGQAGRLVTIQGDVTKAGVYPMGEGLLRLSDVLALASPDQSDPEQTSVSIRRGVVEGTVRLSDVYRDKNQDVALRPGDSIVVRAIQDYVTVVGAAGLQGRVKIVKRNYSVLDVVADSHGLSDANANPHALFLLGATEPSDTGRVQAPRVYQFDMRQPDQVALASRFVVRDGEIVLISDAPFTQVEKALSALSASLGTARSVSSLSQ
jgi:polysaccharide export outer membrane protein